MASATTDFDTVAFALKVRAICNPLEHSIYLNMHVDEAVDEIDFVDQEIPIKVLNYDKSLVGFLWMDELRDGQYDTINQAMEPLEPSDMLSADTSLYRATELFSKSHKSHYYVLNENEVLGILRFSDLSKPTGRLAFIALALETEALALKLCQHPNTRGNCWAQLPKKRQKKLIDFCKTAHNHITDEVKYSNPTPSQLKTLIDATSIRDKATMISKCQLVESEHREDILNWFEHLKEIRDACVHVREEVKLSTLLDQKRVINFVNAVKKLHTPMQQAYAKMEETRAEELLAKL